MGLPGGKAGEWTVISVCKSQMEGNEVEGAWLFSAVLMWRTRGLGHKGREKEFHGKRKHKIFSMRLVKEEEVETVLGDQNMDCPWCWKLCSCWPCLSRRE